MNNALIQCPSCRAWLVGGPFNQPGFAPCPACGVPLRTEVFPALFRKISAGQSGEAVMVEGESSCFYHPQKKAVLACDGCGRFLCALCDCPLHGQHFCTTCLEAGQTKGKIKGLENQRTLYDSVAMALAIWPLIFFLVFVALPYLYFGFLTITGLMALYVVIRHWKAPPGIVRRTKIRFIIALIIALLEIGSGITTIIYYSTGHAFHA
jgi:hypothetical protein